MSITSCITQAKEHKKYLAENIITVSEPIKEQIPK